MEIFIISIVAFIAAILTFFSGFGLGTLLTPVFMVFFPTELAIALTGVVHFFNNLFKLVLVGKQAHKGVLIKFGVPAVIAALIGAWLLLKISDLAPLYSYYAFSKLIQVYPVKFIIAILLFLFAIIDLIPKFKNIQFAKNQLPLGGFLSGFFGGLSGNQGALRSAFLIKAGLTKEQFIGTAVVISTFVDFTRLGVYATRFYNINISQNIFLIVIVTFAAIFGAYLGNKLLKKVTLKFVQLTTAILLIILSIGLAAGII